MNLRHRQYVGYVLSAAAIALSAASMYLLMWRGSSRWTLTLNVVALLIVVFTLILNRRGIKDAT